MKWGKGVSVSVEVPAEDWFGKTSDMDAMLAISERLVAAGVPAGVLIQDFPLSGAKSVVEGVAATEGTLTRVLSVQTSVITFVWTP